MFDPEDRSQFLNFAGLIEGGLILLALGLGWLLSIDPLEHLAWDWRAIVAGVLGTVPLFGLFWLLYRFPFGPMRRIRDFLTQELAPSLANLRGYDLILLSILAGVAEELLFRGLLLPWLGPIWSNLVFGLVHSVTLTYALLAFGVGHYLTWLMSATAPDNLLTPIVTHALHDYLAFLVVIAAYRRERQVEPSTSD